MNRKLGFFGDCDACHVRIVTYITNYSRSSQQEEPNKILCSSWPIVSPPKKTETSSKTFVGNHILLLVNSVVICLQTTNVPWEIRVSNSNSRAEIKHLKSCLFDDRTHLGGGPLMMGSIKLQTSTAQKIGQKYLNTPEISRNDLLTTFFVCNFWFIEKHVSTVNSPFLRFGIAAYPGLFLLQKGSYVPWVYGTRGGGGMGKFT